MSSATHLIVIFTVFAACLTIHSWLCFQGQAQAFPSDSSSYKSTFQQDEGTELVLLYITSQDCGPCHDSNLKKAVDRSKVLLQQLSAQSNMMFSAIGIVKNYDWEEGIRFINEAGYFDEIIAGRSWFNTGVVEYCWNHRDLCNPLMPQIMIFKRDVYLKGDGYQFSPLTFVASYEGGQQIINWVENGAFLAPLDR